MSIFRGHRSHASVIRQSRHLHELWYVLQRTYEDPPLFLRQLGLLVELVLYNRLCAHRLRLPVMVGHQMRAVPQDWLPYD